MPALHIYDVARIGHDTFTFDQWPQVEEPVREQWRSAVQKIADGQDGTIEDLVYFFNSLLVDFVEACRPYFEPEPKP